MFLFSFSFWGCSLEQLYLTLLDLPLYFGKLTFGCMGRGIITCSFPCKISWVWHLTQEWGVHEGS